MIVGVATVAHYLDERHYLGAARRGFAWSDDDGVLVLAPPTSRRLPLHWLELTRWCLEPDRPNSGSRQWAAVRRYLRRYNPEVTTVVSYSDPSVGHTGALYRAAGWLWAPTWHRLRPPPSGQGRWSADGPEQAVKDRWVDVLAPDPHRLDILTPKDPGLCRRYPWAAYTEPDQRRGTIVRGTGGGNYARWAAQ